MKKIQSLLTMYLIFFSGCTISPAINTPLVLAGTQLPTEIIRNTDIPNATKVVTFDIEASSINQKVCDRVQYSEQQEENKLLLYEPEKGLYFWNIKTDTSKIIPDTQDIFIPFIQVSPDNTKVAYFDSSGSGIIISLNQPVTRKQFVIKNTVVYGWVSNTQIIFADESHSDGSMIVFDIKDNTTKELITNLEDINFDAIPWYANGSQPSVIFDSTLTRFIYLSNKISTPNKPKIGFVMRDYETKEILWQKHSFNINIPPTWSPNNRFASIVVTEDVIDKKWKSVIYILGQDGKEEHIIEFNNIYLSVLEWSPDSKKISFTFSMEGNLVLGVYEFASNKLKLFSLKEQVLSRIVWDPHSSQIATNEQIIDITNDCLFKITSNNYFESLAWLKP